MYGFPQILTLFSALFLVSALGVAQQAAPPAPAANTIAATSSIDSNVAPDAAVITIHGLCPATPSTIQSSGSTSAQAAPTTVEDPSCQTIMTRKQFEALMKGVGAKVAPQAARGFAEGYPEAAMFAQKALDLGLDKKPEYEALLAYRRNQNLYQIFKAHVLQQANEMSDADVEKFYNANKSRYEEFGLLRIYVPDVKWHKATAGSSTPRKEDKAADAAAMKAVAERIRVEAVAGGNFERLQAQVYKAAGITDEPPNTDLGNKWTRDNFPKQYESAVLELKVGQISELIHNASGWHIIKVVSRKTPPLSEARQVTLQMIVGDQANALRRSIKTELNDHYFSSVRAPEAAADDLK